ncbi:hypothetical protein [Antarctobacter sp.]|uniref:hypothetical protein n=1 Tax=Antarctobacter sp. TaxID=1872577 RepID=UPI003A8D6B56
MDGVTAIAPPDQTAGARLCIRWLMNLVVKQRQQPGDRSDLGTFENRRICIDGEVIAPLATRLRDRHKAPAMCGGTHPVDPNFCEQPLLADAGHRPARDFCGGMKYRGHTSFGSKPVDRLRERQFI